jgi:hypothetical protein
MHTNVRWIVKCLTGANAVPSVVVVLNHVLLFQQCMVVNHVLVRTTLNGHVTLMLAQSIVNFQSGLFVPNPAATVFNSGLCKCTRILLETIVQQTPLLLKNHAN